MTKEKTMTFMLDNAPLPPLDAGPLWLTNEHIRSVPCPTCGAEKHKLCRSKNGNHNSFGHAARFAAAEILYYGQSG